MNIYLLTRNDYVGYDEYDGKVIRAESEEKARICANCNTADEGEMWTDKKAVTCELVPREGETEHILESFRAG